MKNDDLKGQTNGKYAWMVAIEQSAKQRYNCITHLKLVDITLEEKIRTPNTRKITKQ
jgi:hypothetical protein